MAVEKGEGWHGAQSTQYLVLSTEYSLQLLDQLRPFLFNILSLGVEI